MRHSAYKILKKYLIITVAAFFYGVGVSVFLEPHEIVPGGVTGIAVVLGRFLDIPTGIWILVLNIPILLIGLYRFGIKFLVSTVYATFAVSFFTDLVSGYHTLTQSDLLAAVIGNILIAVSLGAVFKQGATTGGMDIIIKLLRLKYPHMRTGTLFLSADIGIIAVAGLLFGNLDAAFYALIGIIVMSYVFDLVLYGKDEAKLIYIISKKTDEIAEKLLNQMDVGVTFLNGRGAYSGKETEVIFCVVKKNISPKVEEIVKETDAHAFLIISSATEIYGEGYKDLFAQKI